jgi:hypothetical protein
MAVMAGLIAEPAEVDLQHLNAGRLQTGPPMSGEMLVEGRLAALPFEYLALPCGRR